MIRVVLLSLAQWMEPATQFFNRLDSKVTMNPNRSEYLPGIWHQAQTFALSGISDQTDWLRPFVGQTLYDPPGLIFHVGDSRSFRVMFARDNGEMFKATEVNPRVVGPDILDLDLNSGSGVQVRFRLAWLDRTAVVGRCEAENAVPAIVTDVSALHPDNASGTGPAILTSGEISETRKGSICISLDNDSEDVSFVIGCWGELRDIWKRAVSSDFDGIFRRGLQFYDDLPMPENADDGLLRTYFKACATMKVNVESPCGEIETRWTTPDRWPHRHMWLWDSGFNSLGARYLDIDLGKDAIRAVLFKQRSDGFIPHTMAPDPKHDSDMTQPPILAWATMKLYSSGPDPDFLKDVYPGLRSYLEWDLGNMDRIGTGLLQWEYDGADSGMDNSPRFDEGPDFDAVDLNCYAFNECLSLANIATELGRGEEALSWRRRAAAISAKVNHDLWDDEDGFYYDRRKDGSWVKVKTSAGFAPLFSGIADSRRAAILIGDHLTNPEEFWAPFPVPSVALNEDRFELDMWRGPTWINYNYLIVEGLKKLGYVELSLDLATRTIKEMDRWRSLRSSLYEFYDPFGQKPPQELPRKGKVREWPEDGIPVISDFFWSSALFVDMLMTIHGDSSDSL